MADLTRAQYEQAISLAQRDGNQAAADALIQEAAAKLTGPAGRMAQMGAGLKDLWVGGKQLIGQDDPGEVSEHMRLADQATGGKMGGKIMRGIGSSLPFMAIPGVGSVAGAAAAGAGQGALMPTENESTVLGKLQNIGEGAAGGALFQKGFNVAAPVVGRVLKNAVGTVADRLPGGAQRVAERGFLESIPEAERGAAEQTLKGAAAARQPPVAMGTTGAPITSGAALGGATPQGGTLSQGARNLLGQERIARETAGDLGDPLRDLSEQAAQTRWGHLGQEVGGDINALTQAKQNVQDAFMSTAKVRGAFDPKDTVGQEIVGSLNATKNPAIRGELERILDQYVQSRHAGDISSLHEFRMTALDDALKRLYKTDTKAAGILRNRIENLKDSFDAEMDRVMGGGKKWTQYKNDYSAAARAVEHAEAGNKALTDLGNRNPTPGGAPDLRGASGNMRRAVDEQNTFGQPMHSDQAREAFDTVQREIGHELLPYSSGPRQSTTGQNLNPANQILGRAIQAQKQRSEPFSLKSAVRGVFHPMADARALDIARRMIDLHVDPAQAAEVLRQAGLPPSQVQVIMGHAARIAQSGAGRVGTPTAVGGVMRGLDVKPQEQEQ